MGVSKAKPPADASALLERQRKSLASSRLEQALHSGVAVLRRVERTVREELDLLASLRFNYLGVRIDALRTDITREVIPRFNCRANSSGGACILR